MDISLNKMGFNLEGVPLNIRQKLELILLSYDNINWCSTKKRLDTHLHEHISIYIERGEIYASCSPLTSYFTELNINDFIKNH